jgi:hypothetical protein
MPEPSLVCPRLSAIPMTEADMKKRMTMRVAVATVLFVSAAVPVWAALQGNINYTKKVSQSDPATLVSLNDTSAQECGPVYLPKMVRERDGSIVGMTFVVDGDDC